MFESKLAAPQAYVLRLPPRAPRRRPPPMPAACCCSGREAGPGLDSDRIALLRSDQRFDFYAASRWAAPAPDLIESVMVDALRATGAFSAVFDDSSPYAPRYNLRCALRRFEADYTRKGAGGRVPPFTSRSTARSAGIAIASCWRASRRRARRSPAEDRLNEVVAAFESGDGAPP